MQLWTASRNQNLLHPDTAPRARELELLVFLLGHKGRAWTRDQLVTRVWGPRFDGDPRTVDLHIRRLRAQVEDDPGTPKFIQTVWGVGYRMKEDES